MPKTRLKHQLSYIERWRTDEEHEALGRGTLFHKVMERHYGAIKDGAPCLLCEGSLQAAGSIMVCSTCGNNERTSEVLYRAVAPLLYEEGTGVQTERQELVEWMYRGYVDCYGLDSKWEIVGIEVPLDFPLFDSGYRLAGTADLLVRDLEMGGGIWIVDHKTCKDLPKKDFDLEDQTAVYTYLLKQAGYDIRGAIYNHVRTYKLKTREMVDDERFKRTMTVRLDEELETCAREVLELMEEAYGNHDRKSHLVYDAPRSPDGERCGWKCNFTEACIAGRKYGPERTRSFLEDIGFTQHETKPGPTFQKKEEVQ